MTEKDIQKDGRSRNWSLIVYPDSAPQDWRDILDQTGEKWIESPLHDKDINELTGEPKKSHWHVIISFSNKKSAKQVKAISDLLNTPEPKKVASLQGSVQYLWHRNNPEKHQYDKSGVIAHNGFKYRQYLTDVGVDTDMILKDIINWIDENNCTEYADLVKYSADEKFDDWFQTVRSQTMFLTAYLRSNRHKPKAKLVVNLETGEITEEENIEFQEENEK